MFAQSDINIEWMKFLVTISVAAIVWLNSHLPTNLCWILILLLFVGGLMTSGLPGYLSDLDTRDTVISTLTDLASVLLVSWQTVWLNSLLSTPSVPTIPELLFPASLITLVEATLFLAVKALIKSELETILSEMSWQPWLVMEVSGANMVLAFLIEPVSFYVNKNAGPLNLSVYGQLGESMAVLIHRLNPEGIKIASGPGMAVGIVGYSLTAGGGFLYTLFDLSKKFRKGCRRWIGEVKRHIQRTRSVEAA
ncbi:hypothetical protein G7Y89_g9854 [Cudoniella acicularis]|uniref:Uncharacterized protein n=1 Tax=Cudoniella acicularis TaxID=354080 RepID=A0A8H4VZM3_9HELO|nr:hypothetical protein G7Y89_g9854 [Cudoniella acicularis]